MSKLIKAVSAMSLAFCLSLVSVLALPSQTANGSVIEATVGGEAVGEGYVRFEEAFNASLPAEVLSDVQTINEGTRISDVLETIQDQPSDVELGDLVALTELQNLVAVDANGNRLTNVTVTWEVPNLTTSLGKVYVLHYSEVRNVWELITPDNVDVANKRITATFADLSPVCVVYDRTSVSEGSDTSDDGETGKNPQTGDTSNPLLYVGIAGIALVGIGAAVIMMKKKKAE